MQDLDNLVKTANKSNMRYKHGAALYDSKDNPICYAHNRRLPNSPHNSLPCKRCSQLIEESGLRVEHS